jgi:hypothetical protein
MKKLSQEEWTEIVGEYVARLTELSHDTYLKLNPPPDGQVQVPTQAEPFCGFVADGVIGMMSMLKGFGDGFDPLQLFLEELSMRLAGMGYMTLVDPHSDPDTYKRACEVLDDALTPSKGTVKQ